MTKLIFLLMILVGCGQEKINNYHSAYPDYYNNFAPEVRHYVNEFEQDSKVFGLARRANNINSIKVIDQEIVGRDPNKKIHPDVVGVCYKMRNGKREIELESEFLNSSYDIIKKTIIYHELGHCVMDKPHNDVLFESGCGATYSIMNSYVPPLKDVSKCWQGMLEEFFTATTAHLHEEDCHETSFGQQCYIIMEKRWVFSFLDLFD